MDGLEAIGNLILGFVQLMVFLSGILVRGFVWIIAGIANQFDYKLGQGFVNKVVLACAIAVSLYLGIGYFLIVTQTISVDAVQSFYAGLIVYPLILISGILWIGYFGAPKADVDRKIPIVENRGTDFYHLYYLSALVPILMLIAAIGFIGAKSDFDKAQRKIQRTQDCIKSRTKKADKLTSLANKIGLGEDIAEEVGKSITERCK